MNNHVTSLELSKKLKELGVKQDSEFYWGKCHKTNEYQVGYYNSYDFTEYPGQTKEYSAFLSTELGAMLPSRIENHSLVSFKYEEEFNVSYVAHIEPFNEISVFNKMISSSKTEQDARAKCLIYLIENNLIEV